MLLEITRLLSQDHAAICLTIANILYVICYGVRDVLWLRIFCVMALIMILPYYLWGTAAAQWVCIWWNLVFLAINVFWIVVIVRERQPPPMTEQQRNLYTDVFARSCTPQNMLRLLAAATYIEAKTGEKIVARATNPNALILIDQGTVNVVVERRLLAALSRGDFVGEMSFLTRETAVADVVVASTTRYFRWERDELERLFDRRPELKSVVNELIGKDLVQKLASAEPKVPELSVDSVFLGPV
jgi:hypothetical protein